MYIANSQATGAWYLPRGRVHDAASFLRSHSAAAAPFQCVMVHSEVVAQLMCQGHCGTKRAVWMVLKEHIRAEIYSSHLLGLFLPIFPPLGICSSLTLGLTEFPVKAQYGALLLTLIMGSNLAYFIKPIWGFFFSGTSYYTRGFLLISFLQNPIERSKKLCLMIERKGCLVKRKRMKAAFKSTLHS